jgi:hypothetical protein
MRIDKTENAVAEYLHELELRLSGLPVLQRRELLAEISAHISSERVERGATSESDVLELLERLGSPEVVADAAYQEAGLGEPVLAYAGTTRAAGRPLPAVPPPPDSPAPYAGPFPPLAASFAGQGSYSAPPVAGPPFPPSSPPAPAQDGNTGLRVVIGIAIVTVVVVLLGCLAGGLLMTAGNSVDQAPAVSVERAEPADPAERPAQPEPPTTTVE